MRKYTKILAVFIAAAIAMAAMCVGASAADYSWTGTWSTSYNDMVLTQTGSTVTGTYAYSGGTISGTVSGNTLTGTWTQTNAKGKIKFVMSADGKSFTGTWGYNNDAPTRTGWNGTRKTDLTYTDGTKATASASLSDVSWNGSSKQLSFVITYANVKSDAWVGIVPAGTADDEKSADKVDITYQYVSKLTSGGTSKLSASLKDGSYELRVYANDNGGALLARTKFSVGGTTSGNNNNNNNNNNNSDSNNNSSNSNNSVYTIPRIYLYEGQYIKIGAAANGKNVSSVRYHSTNTGIAKVTSKGKLKAVSAGTCVVSVITDDATVEIQVVVEPDD